MKKILSLLLCCFLLMACEDSLDTYTLYRNSVTPDVLEKQPNARIHYASFDSINGENYNRSNCEKTAKILQEQPDNLFKYWCEKGVFEQ